MQSSLVLPWLVLGLRLAGTPEECNAICHGSTSPRSHLKADTLCRFWRKYKVLARHRKLVHADDADSWEWEALQDWRSTRMAVVDPEPSPDGFRLSASACQ